MVLLGNYPRGTGILQVVELNQGKLELVTEVEHFISCFKCIIGRKT